MSKKYDVTIYKQTIIDNNKEIVFKDINTELKNTQSNITYNCAIHGEGVRKALYLYEGRGCAKCAYKQAKEKRTLTTKDFIRKAQEKHGDTYDYSNSVYITSNDKIKIVCSQHGEFEQFAYTHLRGSGCKHCGWIETAKKSYLATTPRPVVLYYIKCYGKNEIFYKIGIASGSVKNRYSTQESMPYVYEVMREFNGTSELLLNIEYSIKCDINPYQPEISFGGSETECFLEPIDIDTYISTGIVSVCIC